MRPLYIKARNLGSFETIDEPLPVGSVGIVGKNGAGKSTFADSLAVWPLFGPDGSWAAGYLAERVAGTDLELEMGFQHGEAEYRVRRGYSARGSGKTTLDFEKRNGVGWVPLTLETQKATQDLISRTLGGMTRKTLLASSVIRQDARGWPSYPAAERKEVIAAGMGLDRFQGYADVVKADRTTAVNLTARLTGGLERADAELAERPTVEQQVALAHGNVAGYEQAHEQAVTARDEAQATVARLDEQRAARRVLEAEAATATATLAALEQRVEAARQAGTDLEAAQSEIATLTTSEQGEQAAADLEATRAAVDGYRQQVAAVEQARRDHAAKVAQCEAIMAQARAKFHEADRLTQQALTVETEHAANCPTCEQTLGAEARAATVANLRARAQEADDASKLLDEQAGGVDIPDVPADPEPPIDGEQALADASRRVSQAQTDSLRRERLTGQVQLLRQSVAAAPAENEVAAATAQATAATSLLAQTPAVAETTFLHARERAQRLLTDAFTIGRNLDAAKVDVARVEERLRRLDELAASTAVDRAERERQRKLIDQLEIIEKAFGRDGIPAMIVERAIPVLEINANRILGELGGDTASARIELRSERAQKNGRIVGALDIVTIIDAAERVYERFSGGEKTRLDLALSLAFACLLESRGAGSRILLIDEPKHLDEEGTAALARVVEGLAQFDLRYVISHMPDLRSAFDQTLEVVKGDDGLSRVIA